jgi:hypothetical protein
VIDVADARLSLRGGLFAGFLALVGAGCGSPPASTPPFAAPSPGRSPPVSFSYETLDGKTLSTETVAGRVTVLAFIATYDIPSQAETRFIVGLAREHRPRLNVGFIVLESKENRPLHEAFVAGVGIPYPVAVADAETIAGRGPFAGLHHVPSIVILDREGREAWRHLGFIEQKEIEQAVRAVERSQPAAF